MWCALLRLPCPGICRIPQPASGALSSMSPRRLAGSDRTGSLQREQSGCDRNDAARGPRPEHAIRVVSIAPGLFDTAMAAGMSAKASTGIIERMVLFPKRRGRAEEFARLVQHVVENEYLNATTIDIDAGTRTTPR